MGESVEPRGAWQRWVRQPQAVWLRRALFQVHLWSGVGLGLYVFFISVTGSVLVYRNEFYAWATPQEEDTKVGIGFWLVGKLIELHDDLLSGPTGRMVNGFGAIAVLLIGLTGAVLWWPGIERWRDHVVLRRGVGWKRFTWQLHSVIGFWSVAFLLVLAASGIYLCFPDYFGMAADWLEPPTDQNAGKRFVDGALLLAGVSPLRPHKRHRHSVHGPGALRPGDEGHVGHRRSATGSDGDYGRHHVVEPRRTALAAAPHTPRCEAGHARPFSYRLTRHTLHASLDVGAINFAIVFSLASSAPH